MATTLHLNALTLVTRLHLLEVCCRAVQVAQQQCPPPLPARPGGAAGVYAEESLWLLGYLLHAAYTALSRHGPVAALSPLYGQGPRCAVRPLLELAIRFLCIQPQVICLDAG
jgi:hypothetical protein